MSSAHQPTTRGALLAAAGLWLAAGLFYFIAEAVAAAAFSPPYSYANDLISDLGVVECGLRFASREICSPRHALMNTAFAAQGVCFVAGAVIATRYVYGRNKLAFVALAGMHAVGLGLVAIFPWGRAAYDNGTLIYHVLGALLAMFGGNAALLAAGFLSRQLGAPAWHRQASFGLSLIGLAALLMLIVDMASPATDILPVGLCERLSVYPIIAWQLLTGAWLASAACHK